MSSLVEQGKPLIEVAKVTLSSFAKLLVELFGKAEAKTKGKETVLGLTLIFIGTQLYYYRRFTFWSRRGVKTPPPVPVFGNYLTILNRAYQELSIEWREKYGKVYGFYAGSTPYLVIADANVLKQICIKDFDKFPNHQFLKVPNRYQKHFLINQKDDEWRALRNLITPTFSSGKIKSMFRILNGCSDDMTELFKQKIDASSEPIVLDIRAAAGALSMGCAVGSFYGIKLNDGDVNTVNSKQFFSRKSFETFKPSKLRFFISSILPLSFLRFINFSEFGPSNHGFFYNTAKDIIRHRLKSRERHNDYLQMLLDTKAAGDAGATPMDEEFVESDKYEEHHALRGDSDANNNSNGVISSKQNGWTSRKKTLNETELACQVVMLMIVATETTSCLMAHAIYLLAHHKEVQRRLREELKSIKREGTQFDYEQLKTHPYLDCVMSESLRLMPPAPRMDREAAENYVIQEYGISIPKGTIVYLDYHSIHKNPEYWPEPDKFDPERFNAENKPKIVSGSYCPFGVGPRFCIGYRFGLTEAKLAVAKLVSEFEFDPAPGTVYPPEPRKPMHVSNEFLNLHVEVRRASS